LGFTPFSGIVKSRSIMNADGYILCSISCTPEAVIPHRRLRCLYRLATPWPWLRPLIITRSLHVFVTFIFHHMPPLGGFKHDRVVQVTHQQTKTIPA
jgi:hypothetical protein